jgi:1,4-alpha-glucan branching enzyme
MINSQDAGNGFVLVTFRLPNINGAKHISLVGEFNAWCPTANPLEPDGDELVTQILLPSGRSYRFRYLVDDDRCLNDWAADSYTNNEFGGDDSVVDLTRFTSFTEPSGSTRREPAGTGHGSEFGAFGSDSTVGAQQTAIPSALIE